jgi:radical SAM superfamily enzyme YgiQ (UPF0313 family)
MICMADSFDVQWGASYQRTPANSRKPVMVAVSAMKQQLRPCRFRDETMRVLLIEPVQHKSWGTNNQYIGLLKIAAYHKQAGDTVEYVRAYEIPATPPDMILVTSMFTYWYKCVWETVQFYKFFYPTVPLLLGGIYATICPEHAARSGADQVVAGEYEKSRSLPPDPTVLPSKPRFVYSMTSYGCPNACSYCASRILYGQGIHQRPIEEVLDEFALQKRRGFSTIFIGDDNFLFNAEKHALPLLERVVQRGLKMRFELPGGLLLIRNRFSAGTGP